MTKALVSPLRRSQSRMEGNAGGYPSRRCPQALQRLTRPSGGRLIAMSIRMHPDRPGMLIFLHGMQVPFTGCRVEHFSGDKDWIMEDAFVSVRKADAFSGAVNWILNPNFGLILDYTYTDLSDPIRVRVNPDGSVDYIDEEHVFTIRSQLVF